MQMNIHEQTADRGENLHEPPKNSFWHRDATLYNEKDLPPTKNHRDYNVQLSSRAVGLLTPNDMAPPSGREFSERHPRQS